MSNQTCYIKNVEALYPRLDKPYHYSSTGGKNGKGGTVPCDHLVEGAAYTVSFKMNKEQAKELLIQMKNAYDEGREDSWPEFKNPLKKESEDAFIGKANIKAAYQGQIVKPPKHFDAANQPLAEGFQLTTNSKINLFVELYPYNSPNAHGITLRIRAVQVLKLEEFISPSPFEAEDGFTKENDSPKADDVDDVFAELDAPVETTEEATVEPKVRENKKANTPPSDSDLSSMLDEFDD